MVAAVRDKRKARQATDDGRLKMHPDTGGIGWKVWEDFTPTERIKYCEQWPDFVPPDETAAEAALRELRLQLAQAAATPIPTPAVVADDEDTPEPEAVPSRNRYQSRLDWFQGKIDVLESIVKDPRESDDRRGRAAADIEQYKLAIEVYTEAGTIPLDEQAWFVTDRGEFTVQVPPVVQGEYDRLRDRLRSEDHYYFAKDPVQIATLRRATRNQMSRIFEKPPFTFPIIDYAHSEFEHWVTGEDASAAFFARQGKRYRPT